MGNLLAADDRTEISRTLAKALAFHDCNKPVEAKRWGKLLLAQLIHIGVLDESEELARYLVASITRVDVWEEDVEEPKRNVPFEELGDGLDVFEVLACIRVDGAYFGGGGAQPAFELRAVGK